MTYPAVMSCVANVDLTAIVRKVGQDDTQIHEASEYTCTETSNRSWRLKMSQWIVKLAVM